MVSPGAIYMYMTTIFKHVLTKTALTIKAKFYVEPLLGRGTEIYINGPGHMTKMVTTSIYGRNLQKFLLQNRRSYGLGT